MSRFSRPTIFEACNLLGRRISYHGAVEDLFLRWELDAFADSAAGAIHVRLRQLFRHLRDNPTATHDGRPLADLVVEEAARRPILDEEDLRFVRSLNRDGFVIENEVLRRTLPETIDLPAADDEVHELLKKHSLAMSLGHLDQAIQAHSRGAWAAANSQSRTFLESLFDETAVAVDSTASSLNTGETRRQFLANVDPPFIRRDLNEWSDDGKNFVNGVFRRLHPAGSHPGLSDDEDSTFRLHTVLLVARLFLRRLTTRT